MDYVLIFSWRNFIVLVECHDNQAGQFLLQLELNALHLCVLADTFLITFSETLLEGLSNGSKDMAKEDDRKARGREPAKRQCRMRREGKRGSWSKGAKENG